MVVFHKSSCIWAKWCCSGKSDGIRKKVVALKQSGGIPAKEVVFGQK